MDVSVFQITRAAWRFSTNHRVPVHRVEMQPGLSLLLSYENRIKGMTRDKARRPIDWLAATPARVLDPTGGEPLLRPDFVHKVMYYAAKKDFWVYLATNARLLRPEVTDRLADAGIATINFAVR